MARLYKRALPKVMDTSSRVGEQYAVSDDADCTKDDAKHGSSLRMIGKVRPRGLI